MTRLLGTESATAVLIVQNPWSDVGLLRVGLQTVLTQIRRRSVDQRLLYSQFFQQKFIIFAYGPI